jgi:general secretion pathway protein J
MTRTAGFTLIELLIGVSLLAILVALVHAGVNGQLRALERSDGRAEAQEANALATRFLRRELTQMLPVFSRDARQTRVEFNGDPDALRFATVLPAHRGVPGVYRVSLRVEPDAGGLRVALYYQLLRGQSEPLAEPTVVFAGLEVARFSYFGRERPGVAPLWLERWSDPTSLPQLVRLEYRDQYGNHALTAPIRTTQRATGGAALNQPGVQPIAGLP